MRRIQRLEMDSNTAVFKKKELGKSLENVNNMPGSNPFKKLNSYDFYVFGN